MKALLAALVLQTLTSSAASILVDSFLGEDGMISDSTSNTMLAALADELLFDSRWVALRDRRGQAQMATTIGQGHADLQMISSLDSFVPSLPSVFFLYSSQAPISFLGGEALQIDVGGIFGRGFVYVEIDTQITPDGELNRFEINGPGLVTIPASSFSLENSSSLQGFNSLNITFEGRYPNFTLTINELRIVPETSVLFLSGLGAVCLFKRRRESPECRIGSPGVIGSRVPHHLHTALTPLRPCQAASRFFQSRQRGRGIRSATRRTRPHLPCPTIADFGSRTVMRTLRLAPRESEQTMRWVPALRGQKIVPPDRDSPR